MARQLKPAYHLTDAQKRDLTQFTQHGKPLPEQYRFILFEDKRDVDWSGTQDPRGLHHRTALPVAGARGQAAPGGGGRASVPARTASCSLSPRNTPTPRLAAIRWP